MRLTPQRYREMVALDSALLADAARKGLDAEVPPCPGWVVRDVVGHTGAVHRQKQAILRMSITAREETPDLEEPPVDDLLIEWFEEGVRDLLAALEVPPDTPVYTWHAADQSAGFWQRRMAHETAIHRADAESAHGPVTPIDAALAADGVDEVLGPIMCGYTHDPAWEYAADGRTAVLRMTDTGTALTLAMGTGKYGPGWVLSDGEASDPTTTLSGTASDMDLWAWGRAPITSLIVEGDLSVAAGIRAVAAEATG